MLDRGAADLARRHERARGRDEEGAELLKKAIAIEPDNADVRHALGLYLVRKRDYPAALDLLRRAHQRMPDNARYAYVYPVALIRAVRPVRQWRCSKRRTGCIRRIATS